MVRSKRAAGRRVGLWCVLSVGALGISALGGCPTNLLGLASESQVAGTWEFFAPEVDAQLTRLAVTFDEEGAVSEVIYKFADQAAVSEASVTGEGVVVDDRASASVLFGQNTLAFDGSLSPDGSRVTAVVSLTLRAGNITVRINQGQRTLTNESPSDDDSQSPLTGTWELDGLDETAQLVRMALRVNGDGTPNGISFSLGRNPTLTDDFPEGSAQVSGDQVRFEYAFLGAGAIANSLVFNGSLDDGGVVIDGTVSLRIESGDMTVVLSEQPAVLARVTTPANGRPVLEGTWSYRPAVPAVSSDTSTLDSLTLTFGSDDQPARVRYATDGGAALTDADPVGSTSRAGGEVMINVAFGNGHVAVFQGTLNATQTTMNGQITVQIAGVTLQRELAVLELQTGD